MGQRIFMRKLNRYIRSGLLIYVLWLFLKQFFQLPEFLNGFSSGLAIALMLWGGYIENYDTNKLKTFKKNIFRKLRNL